MEWGSILSGIGTIAGGLGLGSKKGPSLKSQLGYQQLYDRQKYWIAKEGAKAAGFHPLYALGTGGSFSPTVSGSYGGIDPGQVGQGLAQVVEGNKAKDPVGKAMAQLGLRQAEAETRKSELGADMLQLELARERQALNAQPTKAAAAKTFPYRPGIKSAEPMPMWIEVMDRDGNIHHMPNPDLGAELPEAFGAGMLIKGQHRPKGYSSNRTGPSPRGGRQFRVPNPYQGGY